MWCHIEVQAIYNVGIVFLMSSQARLNGVLNALSVHILIIGTDRTTMYCQTRLNCEYDKGCLSLSAITYSDLEAALASRRQFTRHLGMGISLLAAFVLSVVEIMLCYDLLAMRAAQRYMEWVHQGTHNPIAR